MDRAVRQVVHGASLAAALDALSLPTSPLHMLDQIDMVRLSVCVRGARGADACMSNALFVWCYCFADLLQRAGMAVRTGRGRHTHPSRTQLFLIQKCYDVGSVDLPSLKLSGEYAACACFVATPVRPRRGHSPHAARLGGEVATGRTQTAVAGASAV